MTNQELRNEKDMLDDNLNRIMITDDLIELRSMYDFAKKRLETIYQARCVILRDRGMSKIKREKLEAWVYGSDNF